MTIIINIYYVIYCLKVTLTDLEKDIVHMNESNTVLKRNYLEAKEWQHILTKSDQFFKGVCVRRSSRIHFCISFIGYWWWGNCRNWCSRQSNDGHTTRRSTTRRRTRKGADRVRLCVSLSNWIHLLFLAIRSVSYDANVRAHSNESYGECVVVRRSIVSWISTNRSKIPIR